MTTINGHRRLLQEHRRQNIMKHRVAAWWHVARSGHHDEFLKAVLQRIPQPDSPGH